MTRLVRDGAFWDAIAAAPEVRKGALLGLPLSLRDLVVRSDVMPLASANGGLIFVRLDGLGRVWELHTLFRPEGWGREALQTAKGAFLFMFELGAQVVVTYELEGRWRSRPARSFGFREAGPFAPSHIGSVKSWTLARADWEASPAHRRIGRCL